jgi:hypothetical protein
MNRDLSVYEANPTRYKMLDSGAVYDNEAGRIVDNTGTGKYAITRDTALDMKRKQKEKGLIAQMRGLAQSQGIELAEDADLTTIVNGAATAIEALTRHMAETFFKSENLRGMGETYTRLITPLMGEKNSEDEDTTISSYIAVLGELSKLATAIESARTDSEVINAIEINPKLETDS